MTDLADRPDVSPELRLVPHAFREVFGRPATGVWYAPGVVRLMPGASVCARWGAIVAGEKRTDGILEVVSINKPAEPWRVELAGFTSVNPPSWAQPVAGVVSLLQPGGATLMCSVDLPAGSGLCSPDALACAAALALRDLWRPDLPMDQLIGLLGPVAPAAFAGYSVGLDLAGAGLLVVDTRIRRTEPQPQRDFPPQHCTSVSAFGRAMTAYHRAGDREPEQDLAVDAALAAGAYGASMLVDEPGRPVGVLVDPARLGAVRAYVSDAFRCEEVLAPRYLTIKASPGATRITP
jgi:galactokinase